MFILNIGVLQDSFQQVLESTQDFSTIFYHTLLVGYPEVKPLFANTGMAEQRDHLLSSLQFVVANLRSAELIETTLKGLGVRHIRYGVLPAHYPLVGHSLIKTLAIIIGEAWTAEIKQAWLDAYTVITTLMLAGADYPAEIVTLTEE